MALNQYETDEQRAEVLVDWLKRNAGYLLLLVIVVVASIAGAEYFKLNSVKKLNETFDTYEQSLTEITQKPVDVATGEKLIAQNEGVYQVFSALLVAKEAYNAGNLAGAEQLLQDALKSADDEGVRSLIQYRLALVQFDQNRNEEALQSLQQIQAVEFLGLRKVLEGDIYLAMGKSQDAKISYEEALKADVVPENALTKFNSLNIQ
ncbi:hypothetical protein DC083_04020 [Ignatzschineria ureiclastica]|uniref:Ancillary SecYEG translocon subunit n=1 Tax=Ignatzschineria ureiclastica TaxID=472582 RepID=A0A2U2AEI9_9GAMM|nr:tetratricopeptide repeat protein [Ignatzschineria ureiclastica]PWD81076.1 hypothetical protein DC083_04020 [Ignatzschineria ureiclastica]GGZ96042.1 hypothetical protein GCM10007162_10110 [Ignatzschineria ureiclastica]